MIFSILYRQQSSKWLDELSNKIENNQNTQSIGLFPSTVLALYIKRKYFVSYGPICNNSNNSKTTKTNEQSDQTSSNLTFTDWIDLLFNGNIRQPIIVTEWPMKFH